MAFGYPVLPGCSGTGQACINPMFITELVEVSLELRTLIGDQHLHVGVGPKPAGLEGPPRRLGVRADVQRAFVNGGELDTPADH